MIIGRLLCALGFHRWEYYIEGVKRCTRDDCHCYLYPDGRVGNGHEAHFGKPEPGRHVPDASSNWD